MDEALAVSSWLNPRGESFSGCRLRLPSRVASRVPDAIPFNSLHWTVAELFEKSGGLVFAGAIGIAVRAIAPFIRHKSVDPPVVVVDARGRFVVSLLSGHWGGGNALAHHLASLIGATPVIATASDSLEKPALDLVLAEKGLKIIDWDRLPQAQGALLEGRKLPLWSPRAKIGREDVFEEIMSPDPPPGKLTVVIDYLARDKAANILRVAIPRVFAGIGFRKDGPGLSEDFLEAARLARVPIEALAAIATVDEKKGDERMAALAKELALPLLSYPADALARIDAPHPSKICGERFGQRPFSVAEGAALLSAGNGNPAKARLLVEKRAINGRLTAAFAVPRD